MSRDESACDSPPTALVRREGAGQRADPSLDCGKAVEDGLPAPRHTQTRVAKPAMFSPSLPLGRSVLSSPRVCAAGECSCLLTKAPPTLLTCTPDTRPQKTHRAWVFQFGIYDHIDPFLTGIPLGALVIWTTVSHNATGPWSVPFCVAQAVCVILSLGRSRCVEDEGTGMVFCHQKPATPPSEWLPLSLKKEQHCGQREELATSEPGLPPGRQLGCVWGGGRWGCSLAQTLLSQAPMLS